MRVLLADDDADQRLLLRRLFARVGIHDVTEATDGGEVLERAVDARADLVVLDLAMPVLSGFDVLPELQARVGSTPIVIVSNFPRARLARLVERQGAVGYVEKRVPSRQLVDQILLAAALTEDAADRLSSRFPRDVRSPGRARRFVRGLLGEDDRELLAAVELLVSELVMNAVEHAGSAPRVDVHLGSDRIRVEVYDDDPSVPTAKDADPGEPTGRGLRLVSQVAHRWGAERHGPGKVVWFEVDRPPLELSDGR
jgi:CheY-like chemotaxis protein